MKKKRLVRLLCGVCFSCLLSSCREQTSKVIYITDTIYVEKEMLVKEDSVSEIYDQDTDYIVERDCNVGSFSKLSVTNHIHVVYIQGKKHSVKVKGLKKTINKYFKSRVENNTLLLYINGSLEKKNQLNQLDNNGNIIISNGVVTSSSSFSESELGEILVTITAPILNEAHTSGTSSFSTVSLSDKGSIILEASGCSMVNVDKLSCSHLYTNVSGSSVFDLGHVSCQMSDYTVSGASNLEISHLISSNIKIEGAGSSQIEAYIDCNHIDCSVFGASSCSLTGKAGTRNFNTSGASNIVMK